MLLASDNPSRDRLNLTFGTGTGAPLAPGHYDSGDDLEGTHPYIDISGPNGCGETTGSFDVHQVAADLSSLWISYEQSCQGGRSKVFGEVRVNVPQDPGAVVLSSRVDWPVKEVGRSGLTVPVEVVNTSGSAYSTGTPTIRGTDFSIVDNHCGRTLNPGEGCDVLVGFRPTAGGLREGVLRLVLDGRTRAVPLTGRGNDGDMRWQLGSEQGDEVGQGRAYRFGIADDVNAYRWDDIIEAQVGSDWYAQFQSPDGGRLLPGTYAGVGHTTNRPSGVAGLSVSSPYGQCLELTGSFTVHEATYDAGGSLTALRVTFDQTCQGAAGALRGEIAWRATTAEDPNYPVFPPGVRLVPARASYVYGQTMYLTAVTTDAIGQGITVSVIDGSGTPRIVRSGTVGDDGRFRTTIPATRDRQLVATVGDVTSTSVAVPVLSRVTQKVSGPYRREGSYLAIRSPHTHRVTVSGAPSAAYGCFVFERSNRTSTGWSRTGRSQCISSGTAARASYPLPRNLRPGARLRVRTAFLTYYGSPTSSNTTGWTYLHVVK
ncbi:hypothetical protein [Nocardioides plantarum]|uniref:Big-1 domain-containing protein n=1 Tax=Nocardioides plantarum TaxID=29299 RepID=A0ABV5K676_9ACTN|nr:hypothetical protein [Nocardioides plantarum]